MRTLPPLLQSIVNQGPPFVGDRKPATRITVDPDWWLNTSSGPVGNRPAIKLPIRWFQDDENSQFANEIEIPNIKQVSIDRQLRQTAGTITVQIYNTITPANGEAGPNPDVFGDPGHFAYARGLSPDANARWGYSTNEWTNLLRENALLRVYQGYGGHDLSIADAVNEGYLILDGVFLVDTVTIDAASGILTLAGRDMAKLLIDQFVWPPTIPTSVYGFSGLVYDHGTPVGISPPYGSQGWTTVRAVAYDADGVAAGSASMSGAAGPNQAVDGNTNTYWRSPIKSSPSDQTWIEFDCQEQITGVFINASVPGTYCMASVLVNGKWASGEGATAAGIPYVTSFGVSPNPRWYQFPARYMASRVRLSFTNLQPIAGTNGFGATLTEVRLGSSGSITTSSNECLDFTVTADGQGYRIVGSDGGVFDYGDAMFEGSLAGKSLNGGIIGIDHSASDYGYWLCGSDGGIFTFGDANFYGSLGGTTLAAPIIAFRATPSKHGYYLVGADGGVFCYGDAQFHGAQPAGISGVIVDFDVTPGNDGYWMLDEAGKVFTFGTAQNYGDLTTRSPDPVTVYGAIPAAFQRSHTGNGYRIAVSGYTQEPGHINSGLVYTFGDAGNYAASGGNGVVAGVLPPLNAPISGVARTNDDQGFWLLAQDGGIFSFGSAQFFGSVPGTTTVNEYAPGSCPYNDYADIVADMLLWAGFWLYPKSSNGTVAEGKAPLVFGNIETTGAYNSVGPIPGPTWDKQQLINVIQAICQVVGYIFRIDEIGAARFTPPNFWAAGNYDDYGNYTTQIPLIDEAHNMTEYTQTTSDSALVSEIIVASTDPYKLGGIDPSLGLPDPVITRFTPANVSNLHGINKPAMIGVPLNVPVSSQDQAIMAELLALQCFFANRQGAVTAIWNPAICIDDQIRIAERSTGENNIHYVTGVHMDHNLDTGEKLASYTTYWLGNSDTWIINATQDTLLAGSTETNTQYNGSGVTISETLCNFLANTGAKAVQQVVQYATAPGTSNPTAISGGIPAGVAA